MRFSEVAATASRNLAFDVQVVPTPLDVFKAALDRKANGTPLPSDDEVWLSGAESRGVAMPDGTIMAAGEVVLQPPETFSLRDVACAQRSAKFAAEARAKSAVVANAVPGESKWGPPLALVGSKIEVEWDKGWCQADVVSEERQVNGRQLFKLFYTDPDEPIESRFQLHHFDKGKQCMSWRPVTAPAASAPRARPTVASTAPAVTRSRTRQLDSVDEDIDAVGSLESLTAMLHTEVNIAESDVTTPKCTSSRSSQSCSQGSQTSRPGATFQRC